jgi:hypothetical protein
MLDRRSIAYALSFSRSVLFWLALFGLACAGCARPVASVPTVHPARVDAALATGPRLVLATRFAAGVPIHVAQPGASAHMPAPASGPVGYRMKSYRSQMALYDVIGTVFGFGMFLGGPIAHVANNQYGNALGSLGLRFGGLLVGGAAGVGVMKLVITDCSPEAPDCGTAFILLGMVGGLITGIVLDYVYLGEKRVPVYGHTLYLRPSLQVDRERATAGVMLRF